MISLSSTALRRPLGARPISTIALRSPRLLRAGMSFASYPWRVKRRALLAIALVVTTAGVFTAIALPSIDPCRVGDQVIPWCPFVTTTFDRLGLRLMIAGVGLLAAAAVILWARRMKSR